MQGVSSYEAGSFFAAVVLLFSGAEAQQTFHLSPVPVGEFPGEQNAGADDPFGDTEEPRHPAQFQGLA
jgi:hypothetical protein